jgi:hypothetical protein
MTNKNFPNFGKINDRSTLYYIWGDEASLLQEVDKRDETLYLSPSPAILKGSAEHKGVAMFILWAVKTNGIIHAWG